LIFFSVSEITIHTMMISDITIHLIIISNFAKVFLKENRVH